LGPVADVQPAHELLFSPHIEGHGQDHRHGDGEDLEYEPDHHADGAQPHQHLVERRRPTRQQFCGGHAGRTSPRPADSAAVSHYPPSTQAAPAATLSLSDTGTVAIPAWLETFAIAYSATPMRRASSGLRVIRGPRVSGCACSAA